MHELSLCESVLDIIHEEARKQGFTRVTEVTLEIGGLAAVDEQAMRFSFDAVVKDTLADSASLHIISIKPKGNCRECGNLVNVNERYDCCPICGGFDIGIVQGEEMRIKEMEVC